MSETYYNISWEIPKEFPEFAPWITRGANNKEFKCKVCNTPSRKLSNMGVEALKSHMYGKDTNKKEEKGRKPSTR